MRRDAGTVFYDRSDIFPYVFFSLAGYALMVAGGSLLLWRSPIGLDVVAAGLLVLLGTAIRNSWAIAVTIVSEHD